MFSELLNTKHKYTTFVKFERELIGLYTSREREYGTKLSTMHSLENTIVSVDKGLKLMRKLTACSSLDFYTRRHVVHMSAATTLKYV